MTSTTAATMIDLSSSYNEIIHAFYSDELALDLLVECEDHVDAGDRVEYWGTTDDGGEWRVHLAR